MIEPETHKIQGDGGAKQFHSKVHEAPGIDTGSGRFVFPTWFFSGRRGRGSGQTVEEILPSEDAASRVSKVAAL
jgi:hypothetical protein